MWVQPVESKKRSIIFLNEQVKLTNRATGKKKEIVAQKTCCNHSSLLGLNNSLLIKSETSHMILNTILVKHSTLALQKNTGKL